MLHKSQHKDAPPQTLKDAIEFDQQRREAAYQEFLANKQRYQQEQLEKQRKLFGNVESD